MNLMAFQILFGPIFPSTDWQKGAFEDILYMENLSLSFAVMQILMLKATSGI